MLVLGAARSNRVLCKKGLTFSSVSIFALRVKKNRGPVMSLQEILQNKGSRVLSISPDATLADVVQKLVKHNCGSLVVCHDDDCTRRTPAPELQSCIIRDNG